MSLNPCYKSFISFVLFEILNTINTIMPIMLNAKMTPDQKRISILSISNLPINQVYQKKKFLSKDAKGFWQSQA